MGESTSDRDAGPLHVVELRVANFMGIKSACVRPQARGVVEVSGENGAGKSTLLRCIEVALGGKKACPTEGLRRGTDAGEIVLDTGEFHITVKLTPKGETWRVKDADGTPVASPMEALGRIYNQFCVDPFAFKNAAPKDRRETLIRVARLDFTEVDALRAAAFEQRTQVNREVNRLEQLERDKRQTWPADLPEEEIDAKESLDRLTDGMQARATVEDAQRRCESLRKDIERLTEELERKRMELAGQEAIAAVKVPDAEGLAIIRKRLDQIGEINTQVRARQAWQQVAAELSQRRADSEQLTRDIAAADAGKLELLAGATMPVPGLSVTDSDVTLNGVPFDQASDSEQIRTSVAIALALNPRFRTVLVRAGYAMSKKTREVFEAAIVAADAQAFVEIIEPDSAEGVFMVEGVAMPVPQPVAAPRLAKRGGAQ